MYEWEMSITALEHVILNLGHITLHVEGWKEKKIITVQIEV